MIFEGVRSFQPMINEIWNAPIFFGRPDHCMPTKLSLCSVVVLLYSNPSNPPTHQQFIEPWHHPIVWIQRPSSQNPRRISSRGPFRCSTSPCATTRKFSSMCATTTSCSPASKRTIGTWICEYYFDKDNGRLLWTWRSVCGSLDTIEWFSWWSTPIRRCWPPLTLSFVQPFNPSQQQQTQIAGRRERNVDRDFQRGQKQSKGNRSQQGTIR